MKPRQDLTQGAIFPHIARMSLPILIGMMAQMTLFIIDGVYVSRLGMESRMAVLNYGFPVFYQMFAFFNGLSIGTNSVLARYIGGRHELKAEKALGQIVWICLGIFLVVVLLYPLAMPHYLVFLKASEATSRLTHQFLTFLFLGMPFSLITLSLGGALRAEGNMRALATAQMMAVFINILIAPFFIYQDFHAFGFHLQGFGLGVKGAGLATTTASFIAAAYMVRLYLARKTHLRWVKNPKWDSLEGVKGIFKVGLPSSMTQMLIGFNLILMTRLAANFGDTAVSAIGIGARIDMMAVFPALAVMTSVLTLVGQNFGARQYDRVYAAVRIGLLTSFTTLTLISIIVFLSRHAIIGSFHYDAMTAESALQDAKIAKSALHYVSFQCLGYGLVGINIVCSGAFQGLGRGLPSLLLTTMRLVFFAFPLAYLLSLRQGEYGLHYAPVFASFVTAIIAVSWILSAVRRLSHRAAHATGVAS